MKHLVQEMELLDKNNNPLSHAKYHREEVKEAVEREKQPLFMDVPTSLKEEMREYLAEVCFHRTLLSDFSSNQSKTWGIKHIWAF